MDIIIGREEHASEPRLRLIVDGKEKFLATNTHVPKTVSRRHCKLSVNGSEFVIENMKEGVNPIYVNGQEVERKRIKKEDKIQLGREQYSVDVAAILSILDNLDDSVSIVHLEKVYNDFQDAKLNMQIRERKLNAISRFSGLITTAGILCAVIPSMANLRTISLVIALIAGLVLAFVAMGDSKKTPLKIKEMTEKFQDEYVCPKCGKPFGNIRYKDLAKYVACPGCKVKFKH